MKGGPILKWSRTLDGYAAYLRIEKGLSDNTVQAYLSDLTQFQRFLRDQGLTFSDVDCDSIDLYLNHLADRAISARSRARKVSAIKGFLTT